jgi:hypothetical protein
MYSGQNGKFFSLDKVSVKIKRIARKFITTYPPVNVGLQLIHKI